MQGKYIWFGKVLGVLLLLMMGIYLVFSYFNAENTITLPGIGAIGLSSRCKHTDVDLCKFINRLKKADYFNGNFSGINTTTIEGRVLKSSWKINDANASELTNMEDGAVVFQIITLGTTVYVRDFIEGGWWKQEVASTKDQAITLDAYDPKQLKKRSIADISQKMARSDFIFQKKEACGNRVCFQYQIKDPAVPGVQEYIYFDTKEYILRKTRLEEPNGTLTEMEYDYQKVIIRPPDQAKKAQPGQNIFTTESAKDPKELEYIKEFEENMKSISPSITPTPVLIIPTSIPPSITDFQILELPREN